MHYNKKKKNCLLFDKLITYNNNEENIEIFDLLYWLAAS